jgi:hypothetical protein
VGSSRAQVESPLRASSRAPEGSAPDLLDLAQQLHAVLTDGAPAAGYHVRRGYAVRDAASKQPLRDSYTDIWLPARERHADGRETDRPLNHFVLAQHLRGRYDVAWTAPSWSSLVVLDIDRPALPDDAPPEALAAANLARDVVLAEVWRAFDFDVERQPVVLGTPGGGYHLYLPFCRTAEAAERTWPNAWAREWFEYVLDRAGIERRPGRLELYPSGVRLRAPCGRGMALLAPTRPDDPDDLRLEPVHARPVTVVDGASGRASTVMRRSIVPMTGAFLAALAAQRRPIESWVGGEDGPRAWSPVYGPFGDRAAVAELATRKKPGPCAEAAVCLSPHKEEVRKAPGLAGAREGLGADGAGMLLRGRAFYDRVAELSHVGLTDPGTRHDGALKLAWYLGVLCKHPRSEVLARVEAWLEEHEHSSTTRERSPRGFVRQTLREVAHYYDTRIVHCTPMGGGRVPELASRPLAAADKALLLRVASEAREAAEAILRLLAGHADGAGRVPHAVELSGTVLRSVAGGGDKRITVVAADGTRQRRRGYVVALEELVRLGVLALHCDYSTGHHGRLYTCWYVFGSGILPAEAVPAAAASDDQPAAAELVLAERAIEEGVLRVTLAPDSPLPCVRLVAAPSVVVGGAAPEREPWWVRMYQRRAFTPAEFFEADARKVLPGPFRHRRPSRAWGAAENENRRVIWDPSPAKHLDPSPVVESGVACAETRSDSVPSVSALSVNSAAAAPPTTELEQKVAALGTPNADPDGLAALLWERRVRRPH